MDSVYDQLATGSKLRIPTVIDTYSRFSPAAVPRFSFPASDVISVLDRVCGEVGDICLDPGQSFRGATRSPNECSVRQAGAVRERHSAPLGIHDLDAFAKQQIYRFLLPKALGPDRTLTFLTPTGVVGSPGAPRTYGVTLPDRF